MANPANQGMGKREQETRLHGTGTSPGTRHAGESHGSATGMVSDVKDKARELASSVATTAGETWDSTRHGAQQAATAVAETAEEAWDSVTRFMRRYPLATFGAGVLLGALFAGAFAASGRPGYFPRGSRHDWWDEESRQARYAGRYNPANVSP